MKLINAITTILVFNAVVSEAHEFNFYQSSDWCQNGVISQSDVFNVDPHDLSNLKSDQGVYCSIPVTNETYSGLSSNNEIVNIIADYFLPSNDTNDVQTHGIIDEVITAYTFCSCAMQQNHQVVDPRIVRARPILNDLAGDVNSVSYSCYVCEE